MSKPYFLAITSAATVALVSLAAAPSAEAHRYHRHRHGGVSVVIGAPFFYGGYGYYPRYGGYYAPYGYRRYEPVCRRWGWVHSRSGRAKWRCIAW
ncbi:MAG TPA: hypothetical protein VNZ50_09555 [Hyphomicrobiaceae bacterium]|jgi:hypothetical protein|nr:hypothetical protein [Hyphomicrobiaceae bacterium]